MAQPPMGGGRCGERIGAPPAGSPLTLTSELPTTVAAPTADGLFRGRITVTNRSSAPVQGTTAASPDVFVTQGGRIVALPPPKIALARELSLAPGASVAYESAGSLVGCADERPLPPGRYEIHAELQVDSMTATGGPWPLVVT